MANKKIDIIKQTLKKRGELEYEKGVREALSVAVNIFNMDGRIRNQVLLKVLNKL